jgi:hypothetical protein
MPLVEEAIPSLLRDARISAVIAVLDANLAPQDAAVGIDFVGRELRSLQHRRRQDASRPAQSLNQSDHDIVVRASALRETEGSGTRKHHTEKGSSAAKFSEF